MTLPSSSTIARRTHKRHRAVACRRWRRRRQRPVRGPGSLPASLRSY